MAEVRHLKNAPIVEAIIDFRVKGTPGFEVERFREVQDQLASDYPVLEPTTLIESGFEIKQGEPQVEVKKREELIGFWFKSSDGLNIAQFRKDGFTFNRLKPYSRWEQVFPEAWKLWELYTHTGAAEFITRVATRFINRLSFGAPIKDLASYLTAAPRAPENIAGAISSFLTRLALDIPETGLAANITQGLEKGVDPRTQIAVILDIDVYKQQEFELRDKEMLLTFDRLRDLKNNIFFSSITDETARLLE